MTTSKSFGYARVSTTSQTNDRQIDALLGAGIDDADIFRDRISGARQSRPGLDDLLSRVRPGDTITVASMDRLGRSALHVLSTLADLEERGIIVKSLKPGEDFSGATGKLVRAVMTHVAEWERSMNAERVAEARAARAARAKDGEQIAGRPITAMTAENVRKIRQHKAKGRTVAEIVKLTGISRASVYRALAD
ncbi:DNA-invertase hin [Microbacterium oxydans]|uniref:DNA-invertase hin n=1 Tax=Microbacterium oxydans TaxID=82380 RepID=A0A3Q9J916_9MICO|nr:MULTISPECIES: recombinase family protein [Microbacterium]AZS41495.1 DNA-invertase hin [Microbacterium oxydans]